MMTEIGFVGIEIGERIDTFAGASGEANARQFGVYGYPFLARKPS
jgi:arsenite methyltransferase